MDQIRERLFERTELELTAFFKVQTSQLPRENIVTTGTPYREVLQIAEDQQADLIVIATHGRAGPGRFLLGSTTERVVRHANYPVLVIRQREK